MGEESGSSADGRVTGGPAGKRAGACGQRRGVVNKEEHRRGDVRARDSRRGQARTARDRRYFRGERGGAGVALRSGRDGSGGRGRPGNWLPGSQPCEAKKGPELSPRGHTTSLAIRSPPHPRPKARGRGSCAICRAVGARRGPWAARMAFAAVAWRKAQKSGLHHGRGPSARGPNCRCRGRERGTTRSWAETSGADLRSPHPIFEFAAVVRGTKAAAQQGGCLRMEARTRQPTRRSRR